MKFYNTDQEQMTCELTKADVSLLLCSLAFARDGIFEDILMFEPDYKNLATGYDNYILALNPVSANPRSPEALARFVSPPGSPSSYPFPFDADSPDALNVTREGEAIGG
jgi:hypothetical protein